MEYGQCLHHSHNSDRRQSEQFLQTNRLIGISHWQFQSAYVKRLTGTGTINMTMDNGSTWTAIPVTIIDWTVAVRCQRKRWLIRIVGFQDRYQW